MAGRDSFSIYRNDLRKVLVGMGVSEKNIMGLFGALDKSHKHTNAISFVNTLERMGLDREKVSKVLRRIGMDDVDLTNLFRIVDESKISAEIGRLYDATIDFG